MNFFLDQSNFSKFDKRRTSCCDRRKKLQYLSHTVHKFLRPQPREQITIQHYHIPLILPEKTLVFRGISARHNSASAKAAVHDLLSGGGVRSMDWNLDLINTAGEYDCFGCWNKGNQFHFSPVIKVGSDYASWVPQSDGSES